MLFAINQIKFISLHLKTLSALSNVLKKGHHVYFCVLFTPSPRMSTQNTSKVEEAGFHRRDGNSISFYEHTTHQNISQLALLEAVQILPHIQTQADADALAKRIHNYAPERYSIKIHPEAYGVVEFGTTKNGWNLLVYLLNGPKMKRSIRCKYTMQMLLSHLPLKGDHTGCGYHAVYAEESAKQRYFFQLLLEKCRNIDECGSKGHAATIRSQFQGLIAFPWWFWFTSHEVKHLYTLQRLPYIHRVYPIFRRISASETQKGLWLEEYSDILLVSYCKCMQRSEVRDQFLMNVCAGSYESDAQQLRGCSYEYRTLPDAAIKYAILHTHHQYQQSRARRDQGTASVESGNCVELFESVLCEWFFSSERTRHDKRLVLARLFPLETKVDREMGIIWDSVVDAVVRGLCRRMEQDALPRSFSSEVPTDTVLAEDVARALYRRMKQKCDDAALVQCESSHGGRVRLDNYDSVMQVCEWMRSHDAQSEECFSMLIWNLYDVFDMLNKVCAAREGFETWKKWQLSQMFVSAISASMSALLLQGTTDHFNQCAPITLLYLEENILAYAKTFANFPCASLLLFVCLCSDMNFMKKRKAGIATRNQIIDHVEKNQQWSTLSAVPLEHINTLMQWCGRRQKHAAALSLYAVRIRTILFQVGYDASRTGTELDEFFTKLERKATRVDADVLERTKRQVLAQVVHASYNTTALDPWICKLFADMTAADQAEVVAQMPEPRLLPVCADSRDDSTNSCEKYNPSAGDPDAPAFWYKVSVRDQIEKCKRQSTDGAVFRTVMEDWSISACLDRVLSNKTCTQQLLATIHHQPCASLVDQWKWLRGQQYTDEYVQACLHKLIVHDSDNEYDSCAICMEYLAIRPLAVIQHCGHTFHADCLSRWTDQSRACPLCRQAIDDTKIITTEHVLSQVHLEMRDRLKPYERHARTCLRSAYDYYRNLSSKQRLVLFRVLYQASSTDILPVQLRVLSSILNGLTSIMMMHGEFESHRESGFNGKQAVFLAVFDLVVKVSLARYVL